MRKLKNLYQPIRKLEIRKPFKSHCNDVAIYRECHFHCSSVVIGCVEFSRFVIGSEGKPFDSQGKDIYHTINSTKMKKITVSRRSLAALFILSKNI